MTEQKTNYALLFTILDSNRLGLTLAGAPQNMTIYAGNVHK